MPFEYDWKVVHTDCSELEMEAYLDAQKSYVKKNSQHEPCSVCIPRFDSHKMHYVIYRCNSTVCDAVSSDQPCEWYAKSIVCDNTKRCVVMQHGYHLSSRMSPPRSRLNLAMKRFVREKTDSQLMPSRILNKMIDEFSLDNASDFLPRVQRYAHYYKTSQLADTNSIDDMEALITAKRFHEGLEETTAFAYGYPTAPNGDPFLTDGSDEHPFVVGFATKRLIKNLVHAASNVLHIDATFKLNTCSFPVVILGVSDAWRQFHPICFFIASDLKQAQIESVVRATFRMFQTITGTVPVVTYVMADADNAERNAMEAVIAQELNPAIPPTYLMCFFHVMSNVKKYIAGMSPTSRELVFKHVYRIHYARTPRDLHERVMEALNMWKQRPDCAVFEQKFTKQWLLGRFSSWQCLSTPTGFAKTNNPVEQFNKQVKRDYTLRRRINVNMLAQELLGLCKHQSARQKQFEEAPRASEDIVRRYKELMRDNRLIVTSFYRSSVSFMLEGEGRRVFNVIQRGIDYPRPKTKLKGILDEEEMISDYSIDTYQQPGSGWMVDVDAGTCQCRRLFKLGHCVHLIAASVYAGLHVEGVSKKRSFANKKTSSGKRKGPKPSVGHALAQD